MPVAGVFYEAMGRCFTRAAPLCYRRRVLAMARPPSATLLQARLHNVRRRDRSLDWLNHYEQFFCGQRMPASDCTWLALHHLTGGAQT